MSADLEGHLCYAVIVAGKNAKFADQATSKLWARLQAGESPFAMFRRLGSKEAIRSLVMECKTGNYTKIARCFWGLCQAADLDLVGCPPQRLEVFHGIGPKTSRFFILWTRPGTEYAALDVHILRWLREQGYAAPLSTPSGRAYADLERAFLAEAAKRGMTPRDLDWEIWKSSSQYAGSVQMAAA